VIVVLREEEDVLKRWETGGLASKLSPDLNLSFSGVGER